jgi:hypothetical protein
MQYTVDLPKALTDRINQYLKDNPDETLDQLIQEALEIKLAPKNLSKFLSLAGMITEAPRQASERAEDDPIITQP